MRTVAGMLMFMIAIVALTVGLWFLFHVDMIEFYLPVLAVAIVAFTLVVREQEYFAALRRTSPVEVLIVVVLTMLGPSPEASRLYLVVYGCVRRNSH